MDYRTVDQLHHIKDANQIAACDEVLEVSIVNDDIAAIIEDEDENHYQVFWQNVVGIDEPFADYAGGLDWLESKDDPETYVIVNNVGYHFVGVEEEGFWEPCFDPMTFENVDGEWTVKDAPDDAWWRLMQVPYTNVNVFATEINLISRAKEKNEDEY